MKPINHRISERHHTTNKNPEENKSTEQETKANENKDLRTVIHLFGNHSNGPDYP